MLKLNLLKLPSRILACCFIIASTQPSNAQQNSFSESASSKINYSKIVSEGRSPCNRMKMHTTFEYTVLTADVIAADGDVPEHCRVVGLINPDIKFEISLPIAWNGRLYQIGSGGFAGHPLSSKAYTQARDVALSHNFTALVATSGHDVGDPNDFLEAATSADFASDSFARHVDFGTRSIHLSNLAARALIKAFYNRKAKYAYWDGCSTGGRHGHIAAQRYPDDFDGILSGAGVIDWEGIMMSIAWAVKALNESPISAEKIGGVVRQSVYSKCDSLDGLEDGILSDPKTCKFDPKKDLAICNAGIDDNTCVTTAEAETLEKIYKGPNIDGEYPYYGYPVGGEAPNYRGSDALEPLGSNWEFTLIKGAFAQGILNGFFKHMAFPVNDSNYDWKKDFSFSKEGISQFDRVKIDMMSATDPDLGPLKQSGGKVIAWHGWHDMLVPADMSIRYQQRARQYMGDDLDDYYRLFMIQGMNHCGDGNGFNRFDGMTALIEWVEADIAPDRLVATQTAGPESGRTRPMCPYPKVSKLAPGGDPSKADDFSCELPTP